MVSPGREEESFIESRRNLGASAGEMVEELRLYEEAGVGTRGDPGHAACAPDARGDGVV